MDNSVIRSMLKWPAVPAVYGWLALDRRGNWLLRNPATQSFDRIGNQALREFIARNYQADERGCWFFQNGPQRVFVRLACTPLVLRIEGAGLVDHCGRATGELRGAWLDEQGSLILESARGAALLDDRDLLAVSAGLAAAPPVLDVQGIRLRVGGIASSELPVRFAFVTDPRP